MHLGNPHIFKQIALASFSAVNDGMHIEIVLTDGNGNEIQGSPIITFREDEELGLQVVIHREKYDVVFPLSELKRAILVAEEEVHREACYDQNT